MITNLKVRVTPAQNMAAVAKNLAEGENVGINTTTFKLKLELEADVATIQKVVAFIKDEARTAPRGSQKPTEGSIDRLPGA